MLMEENIRNLIIELCEEVKSILEYRITKYGINPKVGINTLKGSNLEESIEVNPLENGLALRIADYWEFISRGWKRTHNYPNTMNAFVRNVDEWVRKNNIRFGNMTKSKIVFLIIRNIINNGLAARPFMVYDDDGDLEKMIPQLKKQMDEWFEKLFNTIMSDIDKFFNKNN